MCEKCDKRSDADRKMWIGIARSIGTMANGLSGVANAILKRFDETSGRRTS